MFLLLSFIAMVLLNYLLNVKFNFWKVRGIPQASLSLLQKIGSIFFLKFPSMSEYNRLKENGLFGFYISLVPVIMITDPIIVSEMFIRDGQKMFNRQNVVDLNDPLGNNIITMHDQYWQQTRLSLSPAFTVSRLKNILPAVERVSQSLENFITQKGTIEAYNIMFRAMTDIISSWIFSVNVDSISESNHSNEFYKTSMKFFSTSWYASLKNLLMFFVPSMYKLLRMKTLDRESESFFRSLVDDIVANRMIPENSYNDYMQFLLKRKEWQGKIDNEELTAQAVMVFLTGLESTAATLTFALYELAKNKGIQRKCQEEIDEIATNSTDLSYDELKPLKYLQCCIDETLRKYPALTATNRVCSEDYEIPSKNCTIPKGTMVYVSVFRIHREPEIFQNPTEFWPERFLHSTKGCDHPGVPYLPFGIGHRYCIGRNLAQIVVKTILFRLLRKFDLNLCAENRNGICFEKKQIILTPKDAINIEFRKRSQN